MYKESPAGHQEGIVDGQGGSAVEQTAEGTLDLKI